MSWLSGWSKRIKITIDCTNIDSDKTWFPVTIFLGTSVGQTPSDVSAIFDEVGAESKKIAVTEDDGETELYVEIEEWDSAGETAVFHVSKDGWTITAASNTEIYIYYDSSHADNDTYVADIGSRTEVWDNNFMMVQHMVDTTVSTITDSTSNNNDGDKLGDNKPNEVDGRIYKGQDFDGIDNYIDCGDQANLRITGNITVEALIKFATSQSNKPLIAKWDGGAAYALVVNPAGIIGFYIKVSGVNKAASSVSTYDDGNWHHCAGYFNGSNVMLNIDGGSEAITGDPTNGPIEDPANELYLGTYTGGAQAWDGIMDEVRVSSTARVAAWVKATYYSTKDDLLSFGSEEEEEEPVSKERDIVYDSVLELSKTRDIVYDSEICLSKERDIVYDSILDLSKTRNIVYDSVLSLSKERSIIYDSVLELSKERNIVYDLILYLSKERNILYDLVLELSKERNILYDLVLELSKERNILYDLWVSTRRIARPRDGITRLIRTSGVTERLDKISGDITKLPKIEEG